MGWGSEKLKEADGAGIWSDRVSSIDEEGMLEVG